MTGPHRRVTQQDIARMTGVSQATVSSCSTGATDAGVRIAPETRERVLKAIAETGYVADPIARRLAARHNRILGVFTYEPVFPSGYRDFYHPFLRRHRGAGRARSAATCCCSPAPPVVDGRRRIFHQDNRLRLADGCVLLGRSLDRDELARLVADGLPFVSVGRRDDAGGPVPYVGADYPTAVAALVRRAVALGHRRLAYVGQGAGPESLRRPDARLPEPPCARPGATGRRTCLRATRDPAAVLDALIRRRDDLRLRRGARGRRRAPGAGRASGAWRCPADLSVVALGDPTRPAAPDGCRVHRIPDPPPGDGLQDALDAADRADRRHVGRDPAAAARANWWTAPPSRWHRQRS